MSLDSLRTCGTGSSKGDSGSTQRAGWRKQRHKEATRAVLYCSCRACLSLAAGPHPPCWPRSRPPPAPPPPGPGRRCPPAPTAAGPTEEEEEAKRRQEGGSGDEGHATGASGRVTCHPPMAHLHRCTHLERGDGLVRRLGVVAEGRLEVLLDVLDGRAQAHHLRRQRLDGLRRRTSRMMKRERGVSAGRAERKRAAAYNLPPACWLPPYVADAVPTSSRPPSPGSSAHLGRRLLALARQRHHLAVKRKQLAQRVALQRGRGKSGGVTRHGRMVSPQRGQHAAARSQLTAATVESGTTCRPTATARQQRRALRHGQQLHAAVTARTRRAPMRTRT